MKSFAFLSKCSSFVYLNQRKTLKEKQTINDYLYVIEPFFIEASISAQNGAIIAYPL